MKIGDKIKIGICASLNDYINWQATEHIAEIIEVIKPNSYIVQTDHGKKLILDERQLVAL